MANLHIAQIEYLSQELFEHVKNVNNLIARGKFELDLVQQTLRFILLEISLLLLYVEKHK